MDASVEGVGGIVFQMRGAQAGTLAPLSFGPNERILMFLSFSLIDPESRYMNSERECLAIVRCLAEIRWLVMGSRHPVMIYTDHEALKGVFLKGETEKGRIANWMDRLGEYDFELHHKSSRDQHMAIADGLSRLPRRLTFVPIAEDSERIAMAAVETTALQPTLLPRPQTHPPPLEVMQPPREEVGQGRDLGQPGTATREEDSQVAQPVRMHTLPRRLLEPTEDRLAKYKASTLYAHLIEFFQGGVTAISGIPRNVRRTVINKANKYRFPDSSIISGVLMWIERTGAESVCLVEEEVPRIL